LFDFEYFCPFQEFGKISPFYTLPAIEHNGKNIFESVAILKYLARTFKVEEHWYPQEPLQQVRKTIITSAYIFLIFT